MIIKEKIGNLHSFDIGHRSVERVSLEWFEVNKKILHKRTQSGREVIIKFLNQSKGLCEDDVLFVDDLIAIVVDIMACDCISLKPSTMYEMASVCYEIGNKHLPLFYNNNELLIPFETPLYKMLSAAGYNVKRDHRKLINQLKTTVSPHSNDSGKQSLFSKIIQLTTTSTDA